MTAGERQPINLTKQLAATRQIEAAIEAYRRGDFDICITLAGAAEGIFSDRKGSDLHTAWMTDPRGDQFGRRELNALVNRERDWLKHPTADDAAEISIGEIDAAVMLVRAMTKLSVWSPAMEDAKPDLYRAIVGLPIEAE